MNPTMTARVWLMLLTLSVLWGGSFFFAELALRDLGPLTVVLGRVGLAAIALNAVVYLNGERMPRDLRLFAVRFCLHSRRNNRPGRYNQIRAECCRRSDTAHQLVLAQSPRRARQSD